MGLVLRFSFAAQVIAAFVIFVLGYIGLFATLILGLVIVRLLYEGAKWIHARATATPPVANSFPRSAGYQIERRIPVSSTQLVNAPPRGEIAFHPAMNRRRVPEIVR
ncbi:MAG TPA: hypothetical protein VIH88_08190 [Candidatus Acidoferrales bacterium]